MLLLKLDRYKSKSPRKLPDTQNIVDYTISGLVILYTVAFHVIYYNGINFDISVSNLV